MSTGRRARGVAAAAASIGLGAWVAWLGGGGDVGAGVPQPGVVVGPGPTELDAAMRAHADPVASYTLTATVDPTTHKLDGAGEIRWRNASRAPAEELWIHLYLNAFKNERSVFLRSAVHGFRGAGLPTTWGWIRVKSLRVREWDGVDVWATADRTSPGDADDETDIRVKLPRSVEPGATITLDVAWDEKLPSVLLRTGFAGSFHMFGQWFPKIARREPDGTWAHFAFDHLTEFYADFGRYDVTVDVPDAFVVGATGAQIEEKREKGRVRRRFVQDDVHDFAFTAWDGFDEKKATTSAGTALRVLYPRGYDRAADDEIAAVTRGLERFGALFGRYPYAQLTVVHPPEYADEAGGMEYPTLITTGGPWWLPYTGVRGVEAVTIHELGHQWFYGLVATDEHRFPFLDEGVNSYAELDAMEAFAPGRSISTAFGIDLSTPAIYRAFGSDAERDAAVAEGTERFPSGRHYGELVYQRTATILLTLGRVYGEDAVRRAVGLYARRHRFGHPTPDNFIEAFRETLGDGPAAALRAALFDRATVDYTVVSIASELEETPRGVFGDPDKTSVTTAPPAAGGYRGAVIVLRRGSLAFPVEVELTDARGRTTRVPWDAKESFARIPYAGDAELVRAVIDPDHRVLLDDDLSNNARRLVDEDAYRGFETPRPSARVFEGALFVSELGLTAVMP